MTEALKTLLLAALLLSLLASPPLLAGASKTGPDGLDLLQLRTLALKGGAYYQAAFSIACRNGDLGAQRDYEAAVKWARESSSSGHPLGSYSLAVLLDNAFGVTADKAQAEELFKSSVPGLKALSSEGDFRACYALGYLHYAGRGGLAVDKAQAAALFLKASDAGDAHASYMCGLMSQRGDGVPQSNPKAVELFMKAAEAGEAKAQLSLGVMYLKSGALGNNRQEAARWLLMASDAGEPDAQYLMGYIFENGLVGEKDMSKALQYYHRSALQGNETAKRRLKSFANGVRKTLGIEKGAAPKEDSAEAPQPEKPSEP